MPHDPKPLTRRSLLAGTASTLVAPVILSAQTADEACSAIDRMIATAAQRNAEAGSWAISVAPSHIDSLIAEIDKLERDYANVAAFADQTRVNAHLATLNAVVSGIFLIAGASVATGPLVIASISAAGVFWLPRCSLHRSRRTGWHSPRILASTAWALCCPSQATTPTR